MILVKGDDFIIEGSTIELLADLIFIIHQLIARNVISVDDVAFAVAMAEERLEGGDKE